MLLQAQAKQLLLMTPVDVFFKVLFRVAVIMRFSDGIPSSGSASALPSYVSAGGVVTGGVSLTVGDGECSV